MRRAVTLVIIIPLAIVLVALAVANRGSVDLTFDPFNPGNPALTLSAPLFVLLFLALFLGMFVGSIATWLRQSAYRRLARQDRRDDRGSAREPGRAVARPRA